jgi:predicted PurR-regulated permease PerM
MLPDDWDPAGSLTMSEHGREPAAQHRTDLSEFTRRVLVVVGLVTLALIGIFFLRQLIDVLLLAFSGVLVAVAIDGLTRLIARYTPLSRIPSLMAAFALLILVVVGIGFLIGPEIAAQVPQLIRRLPQALSELLQTLRQMPGVEAATEAVVDNQEGLPGLEWLAQIGGGIFATALGAVTAMIVIPLLGIYLVIHPQAYIDQALMLIPAPRRKRTQQVLIQVGRVLRLWMLSRLISMVFVGVATAIGLALLGVPLALALGLISGLLTFIPYLGPIIAVIPTVLVALMESPQLALYAALLYAGVEQVESSVVQPLAQKGVVHIPPAYSVVIQLAGGMVAGMIGVILATPLAVAAAVMVQMLYIEDVLGDEVEVMGS